MATVRFNDLPKDFVFEILSWLPAESLVRFKCVHKSWYSLIEDPQFVAKQLTNHVRSPSSSSVSNLCLLLRRWICSDNHNNKYENILSLLTYDDKMQASHGVDDFHFLVKTMGVPFIGDDASFEISGNCNGIICFYDSRSIVISNPGTREFRILPDSCNFIPPPHFVYLGEEDSLKHQVEAVGLRYDHKTNDYKIVRVWTPWQGTTVFPQRAEVYTLSSDSWREIENPVLEVEIDNIVMKVDFNYMPCFQRYWNGVYYWYAMALKFLEKSKNIIASFDMIYEVFQYITVPKSCQDQEDAPVQISLMEFKESLALLHHHPFEGEERSFDIWMMDEFGVNGTWTKILCIGPFGVERPLLFVKSDELLMEGKEGCMVSYNLETKQVKTFPIYGEVGHFQVVVYKQSLVSIQGGSRVDN